MNNGFIFGKIHEMPQLVKSESGVDNVRFVVKCMRPFRNPHGEYVADYFECYLWRGLSETMLAHLKIGDTIAVKARLESSIKQTENGPIEYQNRIIAEDVSFHIQRP